VTTFSEDKKFRHTELAAAQQEIDDLRAAMTSRPMIDQAKGILMARHSCSPDEAFQVLATASQRGNRKLREVAAGVVSSVQSGMTRPDVPPWIPEADRIEQAIPADPEPVDEPMDTSPAVDQADEADVIEQSIEVPLEDDAYPTGPPPER
jgi:hypothetical protein